MTEGTHRVRTFTQTWAAVQPLLHRLGITRVANVTGLDDLGIPVVMVVRPNARSLAVAQGKGLTLPAARASGVMEAAEMFHAEEAEPHLIGVAPNALAETVELGRLARHRQAPFDAGRPTAWMRGRSLHSGDRRWVPYECVQLGRIRPAERTFALGTSGLASGNTYDEALSHALCELAERHAQAIWNRMPRALQAVTRVDLGTVADPACRALLARCTRAGVAVGVWNLTCELGLPTYTCALAPRSSRTPRALPATVGSGCHPDRTVALARAVTEAAQARLTHIAGARDDMSAEQYTVATTAESVSRTLTLIASGRGEPFDRVASRRTASVSADLEAELAALQRASLGEAIAVDLTRPGLGLPVVRVVVPGLEHPDPPAHLFDAGDGQQR